ncbi:hypothetical protein DPMN_052179 [Dreissena polymorpha]|uniref:Uncharacterized protein n=1 Tax=Dreissena polymorpha TaxID=45954 RepID=A0A9D4CJ78_DREPO|nr:hypothetical protein DPMN_052179 [Dreissena polymorpha]
MPKITVSVNGVQKLLYIPKPDKAAGPDNIKPLVLKELRSQISPIITLLFQKSLDSVILLKCYTAVQERKQRRPIKLQTYLTNLYFV